MSIKIVITPPLFCFHRIIISLFNINDNINYLPDHYVVSARSAYDEVVVIAGSENIAVTVYVDVCALTAFDVECQRRVE